MKRRVPGKLSEFTKVTQASLFSLPLLSLLTLFLSSLFKQEIEYFRQHDSLDGKVRIQLGGTGAAADEPIERGEEKDGKPSPSDAPKVTTHSLRGIHRRS
jgi:hypothetical protein